MKTTGKACRPIGENLEESAAALKDHAEVIKLIGWGDQARILEELASTLEKIGRMVRSGRMDVQQVPAFLTRNA
jgi:hypothetical protein